MKGHRNRLSPDPAASRRLYEKLRERTHIRSDIIQMGGRIYMSRAKFAELKVRVAQETVAVTPSISSFGGVPIEPVDWLPHYQKRHRPSVERRIARRKAAHVSPPLPPAQPRIETRIETRIGIPWGTIFHRPWISGA